MHVLVIAKHLCGVNNNSICATQDVVLGRERDVSTTRRAKCVSLSRLTPTCACLLASHTM